MQPRIYVACLAAYNNGKLYGTWIDADQEPKDIEEAVQEMLKNSSEPGAEEWAIHDYKDFGPLELDESEGFNVVSQKAQLLVEYGEVFGYALNNVHGDIDQAVSDMNNYKGGWNSVEDFARHDLDESDEAWNRLPTNLQACFDFEKYVQRELRHYYYWFDIDDVFHIFRNN